MKLTGPYATLVYVYTVVMYSRVYYGDANGQSARLCTRASIQLAKAAAAGCIRDPEGAIYNKCQECQPTQAAKLGPLSLDNPKPGRWVRQRRFIRATRTSSV